MVYFVEKSARASELIRQNLQSLGVEEGFRIIQQDVGRALRWLAEEGIIADFIFLDPPYQMGEAYGRTLESFGEIQLPKPGSLVLAEHQKKFDPGDAFASLHRFRKLEQGDAALSFYRRI